MTVLRFPQPELPQPFDLELEQALLGAVLSQAAVGDRLIGWIRPAHFAEPGHAHLWEIIEEVHATGVPATFPNVLPRAGAIPGIRDVGGRDYILRLATGWVLTRMDQVVASARLLIELAARREAAQACENTLRELRNPAAAFEPAVDACETALGAARLAVAPSGAPEMFGAISTRVVQHAASAEDQAQGLGTGIADLDEVLGGMRPGNLVILGGRPGIGKTAAGLAIALAAGQRGEGVGFFSLEMTNEELAQRAISALAYEQCRVPYHDIGRRNLAPDELEALKAAQSVADHMPIMLSDLAGQTIATIRANARRMARDLDERGASLRLLVVDHLTLVRDSGRWGDNKVATVGEISGGLKALAKELDIPVLALCQLNRGVEGRDDKRPSLADLRWSSDLEQDADQVMLLYREEYYLRRKLRAGLPIEEEADLRAEIARVANRAEIIVAKNRHGSTGTVEVFCDITCNMLRNVPKEVRR